MTNGELFFRIFGSVILGGLVGFERERHNRPAGLRTHILVCLGSTLVMIVSVGGFSGDLGFVGDPSRIAAQVVSGVGFLGAGTILRKGGSVRGLTTAASLWVVAAIGLAVGVGLYRPAVIATAFVLVSLFLLHKVEANTVQQFSAKKQLWLHVLKEPGLVETIGTLLKEMNIRVVNMHLAEAYDKEEAEEESLDLTIAVDLPSNVDSTDLLNRLMEIPGLLEATVEPAKRASN